MAGQAPTYERLSPGRSVVSFPGVSAGYEGVPIVTALASTGRACVVNDWVSIGDVSVLVSCFRADGAAADTPFSTNILMHGDLSRGIAYVYAFCGNDPCSIGPDFDSKGGLVEAHRVGTGVFSVKVPGMANAVGNVQVSAQANSHISCRATNLGRSGDAKVVGIACRDRMGALIDTGFLFAFTSGRGLTGVPGRKAAFLLAGKPKARSYRPGTGLWFSSAGTDPIVARNEVGTYLVTLPHMPRGGSAELTPIGEGRARCTLTRIRIDGAPQRIGVRCQLPNGDPADTKFSLSYTH